MKMLILAIAFCLVLIDGVAVISMLLPH